MNGSFLQHLYHGFCPRSRFLFSKPLLGPQPSRPRTRPKQRRTKVRALLAESASQKRFAQRPCPASATVSRWP